MDYSDNMAARQNREQARKRSSTTHSADPPKEKKGRHTGPFQESIGPVLYDSSSKYKILNLYFPTVQVSSQVM